MPTWTTFPEKKLPREAQTLAEQVEQDGGHVLSIYQDPVGEHWHLFCLLPIDRVAATPYQRDLSPTHVRRLQEVMKKIDRFVDPIVAVSPRPGAYWTPNGHHRLAALKKLKGDVVPAVLIPEQSVAYEILALNTEKAHNLKEKSLEVIRMYRALAEQSPRASEEDYAFQFESAHYITLGLLYEENRRFSGGAFSPILRRVDKFLKVTLPKGLEERQHRAALVREADEILTDVVDKLRRRGLRHPYVKNFVLARTTPLTRARKTLPSFETTFRRLADNLRTFDVASVRYEDIARSALMPGTPGG
ncbi:MAG: ParB N-terminal domain-containing protein [Armatimonadota bacterium]|nr:ParB N-terminal domain-containing protein [Armatimonadota bacterium]MDR7450262.1 ParB N-terminal domain-containing protein [Armatimonadota bacterium]MDR7467155.1 ParB N-terminal domain-containing protein [Armatimonadota bacterium]MDR7493303.1 ParB N-terminal domain-containing protein [Armatimonadota bacterium]MDR7500152.1 ParB N-terminal domain-containing protein [Armatimonadota bacterium]